MSDQRLPDGVELIELTPHADDRGVFTELFREEWTDAVRPIQWNGVFSKAGVLRGVHVHPRHTDYLTMASGRMTLGLCDLRPASATYKLAVTLELSAETPCAGVIPPGVAHGFYFPEDSIHVYAVSHYWDTADELGCRWDDPALQIPWQHETAQISQRDAALQSLANLERQLTSTNLSSQG
jgi:dTDP-4-dehydrorhamnose 3,5-epimerase